MYSSDTTCVSSCMGRLLNPVCRDDLGHERTFRLLRRFQATGHLPGSPPPFLVLYIEEELAEENIVMEDNDIIGITSDMARNIRDYGVFDTNDMNIGIIKPEIIVAKFKFKPMMF